MDPKERNGLFMLIGTAISLVSDYAKELWDTGYKTGEIPTGIMAHINEVQLMAVTCQIHLGIAIRHFAAINWT